MSRTYAVLEISAAAYDEIRAKLEDAGYGHAFDGADLIDMHGIAVQRQTPDGVLAGDASKSGEADGAATGTAASMGTVEALPANG